MNNFIPREIAEKIISSDVTEYTIEIPVAEIYKRYKELSRRVDDNNPQEPLRKDWLL